MIPKQLLQSLNLHDTKDIKMAQNLWKMLDEMADGNPQDYQNFIDKNLKQGIADLKEQKQKKQQPLKVTPEIGFLLELDANIKELSDIPVNEKFKVNNKAEDWNKVKNKFQNRVQVYLNVCYSNRVILPLDKDNNEVSELNTASISKIASIPYSLQDFKSTSQGKVLYYILVLNDQVFKGLKQLNPSYLINMSCSLFQERLKADKNPLFSLYNPNEYLDKLVYYEVRKESIKVNKQINFKYDNASIPQKILLQPGSDYQQSRDIKRTNTKKDIKYQQKMQVQQIKLPQIKFQQSDNVKSKRVFIEQIPQNAQNKQDKIPFSLTKSQKQYRLQFLIPGISSIKQLELDANIKSVKVNIPQTHKHVLVDLDKAVDVQQIKAKFLKKQYKLCVTLPFK